MRRPDDIAAANELGVDYVGFVFAEKSKRRVSAEQAAALKALLDPAVKAVGVFVNAAPETVAGLLEKDIIDLAQLHGTEDAAYIERIRELTGKPLIRAFRIRERADLAGAESFPADHVLLDAGAGDGRPFDWDLLTDFSRPYFLAGGLTPENVGPAVERLRPFAVDVSSGIETAGFKDLKKMTAFVNAVREKEIL